MPKVPQVDHLVPYIPFEEYKKRYEPVFLLERSDSGVVTAKWHNGEGEPANWDYILHRGIGQLTRDIAQDPESEVLILGGVGDEFLKLGATSGEETPESLKWMLYEHNYYDGTRMVEGLVNEIEQPTIGVINGGLAVHTEIATLCDVTLMADDATIFDPHFKVVGGLPGDGIQIAMRAHLGIKRSTMAMLFGTPISAQQALEWGLVSEIHPKEKLYDRAKELAEELASKPRMNRRLVTQITRLPLKEQVAKELRMTFGAELWGNYTMDANHDEAFETMNEQTKDMK